MRTWTALLALTVLLSPAAGAQKIAKIPTRPRLDPGADTNDARSYYQYGVRMLDNKPEESVRAFYSGWYKELVTTLPVIEDGYVLPMEGPGLGTELLPAVFERPDLTVRRSEE